MQNIGFIGLGIMGKPMALNLIKAGYNLHIYARKDDVADFFVKEGAHRHASPRDLAPNCDVIITNVSNTNDVEQVLLGKYGIIHSANPGTIVIDMSTISIQSTQRFANALLEKQIHMLDAPVSGGEMGAINATLTIMVGGEADILEKVRPILNVLGKKIIHIGKSGSGQVAKACNQIVLGETIVAVSEALRLAKASGVEPEIVREALMNSFAQSKVLELHGKRMLDSDYKPGFKASLHRKDMHLALEQAHLVDIVLPSASYAMKCLDRLVLKGHSDLDSSALHLVIEE